MIEIIHRLHKLLAGVHDKRAVLRDGFTQGLASDQQRAGGLAAGFTDRYGVGLQPHAFATIAQDGHAVAWHERGGA